MQRDKKVVGGTVAAYDGYGHVREGWWWLKKIIRFLAKKVHPAEKILASGHVYAWRSVKWTELRQTLHVFGSETAFENERQKSGRFPTLKTWSPKPAYFLVVLRRYIGLTQNRHRENRHVYHMRFSIYPQNLVNLIGRQIAEISSRFLSRCHGSTLQRHRE